MEVQQSLEAFRRADAEIVVITFVQPERLRQYLALRPWPFRVLADPQRAAYAAFGLEQARWRELLHPRALARYLQLLVRGRRLSLPQEDVHQLGGDFVLDGQGRQVFGYRSRHPADRPTTTVLLEAVGRVRPTYRRGGSGNR